MDVVGWQADREVAAVVPDGQSAVFANVGDGPAVAVLDPVGGGESELSVVGAGDDHVSDARLVPVGQEHLSPCRRVVEAVSASTPIEFGDELAGRGEHDRVESCRSVNDPSVKGILRGFGEVADMDASVIEVEVECRRVRLRGGRGMLPLRRGR